MMCWRERPVSFGPGPMGAMTLVAMTTPWRFPRPQHGLRFPARVARYPAGVHVGGVDEVAAGLDVGVEHGLRRLLVRRPPERVAAETQGGDSQPGATQLPHQHDDSPWAPSAP